MTETPFSKAVETLEEKGWSQASPPGDGIDKGACLWTAVGSHVDFLLRHFGVSTLETIFLWNDAPGRTKEEVVGKLWDLHAAWLLNITSEAGSSSPEGMDIGEEKKEVEFEPLESPVEAPVEVPEKELEPA